MLLNCFYYVCVFVGLILMLLKCVLIMYILNSLTTLVALARAER